MSNDTQHYTNLEIFHALIPKMKAAFPNINNWDELDKKENYDDYRYIIDAIATAYRSGVFFGKESNAKFLLVTLLRVHEEFLLRIHLQTNNP